MYDKAKLKRVIARLNSECDVLAVEFGRSFNDQFVAERIFERRNSPGSRKTAWSQFQHKKLGGQAPISSDDIEEVFEGYRKSMRDLTSGVYEGVRLHEEVQEKAVEIESKVLNEFGLAHIADRLRASMFLVSTYESDHRTPALAAHDPVRIREFSDKLKAAAARMSGDDIFVQMCREAGAEFVKARPESADLSKVRILSDSIAYDNTDWEPVAKKNQVQARPIQACYSTRVLRILVEDPGLRAVSLELNSNGFGVMPVPSLDPAGPEFRIKVQDSVYMPEAHGHTRTTYVEFELSPEDVGVERTFIVHSIFYNGLQDSTFAVDEKSCPVEMEWHGKRVAPGTEDADMAVILPASIALEAWRFVRRHESDHRDIIQEVDHRETIFEPSMQRAGSVVEGVKAIWKMPHVQEPTIFSFQWCWE